MFHFRCARLEAGRPRLAAAGVAQVQETAPAIARGVLPPAGDGEILEPAEPGACRRDHHRVAAIGQQMAAWSDVVRRLEPAQGRQSGVADQGRHPHLLSPGPCHGHRAR